MAKLIKEVAGLKAGTEIKLSKEDEKVFIEKGYIKKSDPGAKKRKTKIEPMENKKDK